MMLFIDLETRSDIDLRKANVYRYTESPLFSILMAAWSANGAEPKLAIGEQAVEAIPGLWDPSVQKVAHNAAFERVCLSKLGPTSIGQWIDTMALAAEAGLPAGLDRAADALGLARKDSAGTRLINLFCKPPFANPADHPDKWEQFCEYCIQDVRVLVQLHRALPDMTEVEKVLYQVDQAINDRGIRVDMPLVKAANRAARANGRADLAELGQLTGLENPNSPAQLKDWLGDTVPNLQAETVEKLLAKGDMEPDKLRALKLRQGLALTASKKYSVIISQISEDNRLRGQFRFYGAHTGRWSGRGVQLHNLPRASLDNDADVALAIEDLRIGLGADAATLKALVRPAFIGPLVVADYSAIEARVLAWLAGEEWVLTAFKQGRDIYVETADRMGGLTRREGKIAVLALGYQGSVGAIRRMGYGEDEPDDVLLKLVRQWRITNPHIVRFWASVEKAFLLGGRVGKLTFHRRGTVVTVTLPSRRKLYYRGVTETSTAILINSEKGRTKAYGGYLVENITQAVARDILAEALITMEEEGLPVVGHVHDEVLVETHNLERVSEIMERSPDWAADLPMSVEAFRTERYRKG